MAICLIMALWSGGCATQHHTDQNPSTIMITETPAKLATAVPSMASQSPNSFERLSSTKIRIGNIQLDVSGRLTQATFELTINGSFPPQLETAYPNYTYPDMYKNIEYEFGPNTIELERNGGGGGSMPVSGAFVLDDRIDYQLTTPLKTGQRFSFIVVVTFNDFIGIKSPVPFTLDLTVE